MNEEKKEETEFEEIISSKPRLVKTITKEQQDLLGENRVIIRNLAAKENMTVKEIYLLFWDSEQEKYSKTLKTIYRYLEQLEQADLIMVSGRRKYKGSRAWERLYCRSAIIYYPEGKDQETSFWETDSGNRQLNVIAELFQEYHGLSDEKKNKFKELFISFDSLHDKIMWEILTGTEENENLSQILSRAELDEIKFVVKSSAMISTILQKSDIINKIQKIVEDK
ncbi:MAG: helix-turn-helix transcriptional regulator [Asgard group archaeon]|nr:helix-turn-helix transcriptional regulator [Asgard group archaeon]